MHFAHKAPRLGTKPDFTKLGYGNRDILDVFEELRNNAGLQDHMKSRGKEILLTLADQRMVMYSWMSFLYLRRINTSAA